MKIKTGELLGAALDWAVAKCEGHTINLLDVKGQRFMRLHRYSTDWSQGGPIIEREQISIEYGRAEFITDWIAYKLYPPFEDNPEGGPTPLIAAMRCYVASKLGDEVEIQNELLEN